MWVWMLIALVIAVAYYLYKKNSSANSANAQQSSATNNTPGGVDSSLVPQFINQNYENFAPPPAPNVTINNTVPIPNPGGTQKPPPNPTPTPPKPITVGQYPAPTGLSTSKVSSTSLKATWTNLTSPTPVPASYTVAVYSKGGQTLSQQTVNAPDTTGGKSTVTITGLPANSQGLQVHVWANGGATAPPHAASTVSI